MFKSKLSKVIVSLLRRIAGVTRSGAKRLMRAMLQTLMAMGRRARLPVAGFVLPTVTMVLLVVILLTVAITLRSFDRANTARNVRVNQQVLAAATPALDRAKAKIQFMLREDPQRPTATPSDAELYRIMSFDGKNTGGATAEPDLYTFGDEERLILRADLNGGGIDLTNNPKDPLVIGGADNEAINTAWRYPVDTNNNGLVDTYTLYGIYFRTPQRDPVSGDFVRARKPLEARTPPMSVTGLLRPECAAAAGTSASLVGNSGWYKLDGRLKKSFFVYTVNVPITENPPTNGEIFKGTPSISALEYQQDQSRIPLSNNAVVYKDDLDISPGVPLNLNGRMVTNSNLLVSSLSGPNGIKLHLVSSENSCFYDQENSKIVVAGNVVNGNADNGNPSAVEVHLFKKTGPDTTKVINTTNQSVKDTNNSLQVLYNTNAYANRIALLVASQIAADPNNDPNTNSDPISVKQAMRPPLSQTREQALQAYFEERTRKVPFAEAPLGTTGVGNYSVANPPIASGSSGDQLRPVDDWSLPTVGTATAGTIDGTGRTGLTLVANGLKATNPIKPNPPEEETFLGDRVVAGNNLPAQRWDGSKFIGSEQTVDGTTPWDGGEATPRTRRPQVITIADVGATDRDGFWEKAAAQIPKTAVDGIGGLRVVTSAGVYERVNSFLPPPLWDNPTTTAVEGLATYNDPATPTPEAFPIVWPDSMPMSPVLGSQRVYNNGTADSVALTANDWATATNPLPNPDATPPTVLPAKQNPAWGTTIDPNTPKYAKGDLRMRATAVYHYAKGGGYDPTLPTTNLDNVRPIACISSYYDPSTAVTARNLTTLPDVSGLLPSGAVPTTPRSTTVGSNNGVVYPPPANRTLSEPAAVPVNGLLGGASPNDLQRQANYVFPDGRFANGPLREALLKAPGARNLADKAAIDSTVCALEILAAPTSYAEVEGIKHGAIQEVAFLNAREVKAIERDDLSTPVDETFTLSSPFAASPRPASSQAAWLKGNYNLALEDREPLEIRATQLNIEKLRTITITHSTPGPKPEWLLPNSGIVFASRDDALPDRSDRSRLSTDPLRPGIDENTSKLVSPTDSLLDPTRKPNGIVLVEGDQLFRRAAPVTQTVTDVVKEKGLTLVSNLPVYTKGNFNLHGKFAANSSTFTEIEEFDTVLDKPVPPNNPGWGNFYTRPAALNKGFACRQGDPRLPGCTGDFWRQANVLADSVTILSENYRFGFRNEGDFDLRNNAGSAVIPKDVNLNGSIETGEVETLKSARLFNGFFTNNFVTNGLTSGAFNANGSGLIPPATTGVTPLGDSDYVSAPPATINPDQVRDSSYFNNFATPVQRRGKFPEYLMEVCVKLPVAACGPNDWFINPLAGIKASDPGVSLNQLYTRSTSLADASNFKAGTTVDPPVPELQRFPRRVAFQRGVASSNLDDLAGSAPQPLGIDTGRKVVAGAGEPKNNSLWFGMTTNGTSVNYDTGSPYLVNRNVRDGNGATLPTLAANSKVQPLLLPVLQIQTVVDAAGVRTQPRPTGTASTSIARNSRWMLQAAETTQNMIVGSGDNPSRQLTSTSGDFNGGLQNLPRFLENWKSGGTTSNIKGAFIQLNRSAYNTAPYLPILNAVPPGLPAPVAPNPTDPAIQSLFFATGLAANTIPENRYRTDNGAGRIPSFSPPGRNWGYDVGMLSQSPDLFTQRFTAPPTTTQPAEYFREVPRNDEWVTTLLCGKTANGDVKAVSDTYRTGCPN
ncbi:hormogonium polysaccharide biosynthesis protein HpsA [Microcoleus sp. Pol12A4]|uniref:hormogonium polysaccharide biosynthesis protein HpsA n=1 Tax=Microcoleus sp. Pol12A4 TaxID=3055391 RepID=UPI002FD0B7FC